jgi:hypothetical protein
VAYELLRELRRSGNLIVGDTVLVELHPDVAQVLSSTDRQYLEEIEKRLQKRIVIKSRGSFHMEDFEIRSPSEKTPIEKSDAARDAETRRRKRRRRLGPPSEVEALLEEEESSAVNPEAMAGQRIGGGGRDEDDEAEGAPPEVAAAEPPSAPVGESPPQPEEHKDVPAQGLLEGASKPQG